MKVSGKNHATAFLKVPSRVGELLLLASDEGLSGLYFEGRFLDHLDGLPEDSRHPILREAGAQLEDYFSGKRYRFDVPLDARGTDFQMAVWKQLSCIPHGETRSYGQIADAMNNPKAVRAVGLANGANPISIIVPCHRVIGANGKLTGFGGGLPRKQMLLELEGVLMAL